MPIRLPVEYGDYVYLKTEVDELMAEVYQIKADKYVPSMDNNIAVLTGDEGNLLDSGVQISDLIITVADGETYS
jgi:hypothetical protein